MIDSHNARMILSLKWANENAGAGCKPLCWLYDGTERRKRAKFEAN